MIVPVVGPTPGRRYGHTIVFSKPYLLVYGGNTGTEPVSDVWNLNVDKAPFSWSKLETPGENPCVRVYHSAALCSTGSATGMMVIFGGRTAGMNFIFAFLTENRLKRSERHLGTKKTQRW